jgi:hypothetical protein
MTIYTFEFSDGYDDFCLHDKYFTNEEKCLNAAANFLKDRRSYAESYKDYLNGEFTFEDCDDDIVFPLSFREWLQALNDYDYDFFRIRQFELE